MKSVNLYYEGFAELLRFVGKNHDFIFNKRQSALLIQVFSGCCEREYLSRIISEILQLIPHAYIIGVTTGGEIMDGAVSEGRTVLTISAFYRTRLRGDLFEENNPNCLPTGLTIASKLNSDQAKLLLLFTAGSSVNADKLLGEIQASVPNLCVAGAKTGDPCHNIEPLVAYGRQITDSGVIGVVFEGQGLTINQFHHLGWQPIGKTMIITKVKGARVYTIDNLPAFKIYQKYLGLDKDLSNALEYPIMIDRCGVQIARVPVKLYEDESIEFASELIQGEQVRLGFGNVGLILDNIIDLCKSITQQPVESIFVYSCACRKSFLQGFSNYETQPLQKIAGTSGFFSSGEFFHAAQTNHLLNASMTVLAISEDDRLQDPINMPDYGEDFAMDNKENLLQYDIGGLKTLTHLVNVVTSELEQAQEKLKYNVIGEIAAALGHEVRNPMTTVRGYLQILQHKKELVNYQRQISTMIEELDQANYIITEFLSLSKNKLIMMNFGNINDVLKTLFPLLQADAFQQGHNIILDLGNIPNIKFDDREVRQVIVNLVHNGLEAMKDAGILTVRTYCNKDELILSVEDTGPGIAPEIIEKLGTPFVTTKEKGTGLGLSICYRIADRHGAKIEIKSGHQGTTIAVKFKLQNCDFY